MVFRAQLANKNDGSESPPFCQLGLGLAWERPSCHALRRAGRQASNIGQGRPLVLLVVAVPLLRPRLVPRNVPRTFLRECAKQDREFNEQLAGFLTLRTVFQSARVLKQYKGKNQCVSVCPCLCLWLQTVTRYGLLRNPSLVLRSMPQSPTLIFPFMQASFPSGCLSLQVKPFPPARGQGCASLPTVTVANARTKSPPKC